jgi:hypothetical protein
VNRAWTFTLLALVMVVVAFAATWLTLPADESDLSVAPPASLFLVGIGTRDNCERYGIGITAFGQRSCAENSDGEVVHLENREIDRLETRVIVVYASVAAVIVLLGLAFGAARRSGPERSSF